MFRYRALWENATQRGQSFACGYLAIHFPARGSDRTTDVILKPAERSSPPALIICGSEPGFPLKRKIPHVYNWRGKGPVIDESQSLVVLKMLCVCSVTQLCLTLFDPMDHSPPGSSVHGILQTRTLKWVAMSPSRGSSQPRDGTCGSCIGSRFFTTEPSGKPEDVIRTWISLTGVCKWLVSSNSIYENICRQNMRIREDILDTIFKYNTLLDTWEEMHKKKFSMTHPPSPRAKHCRHSWVFLFSLNNTCMFIHPWLYRNTISKNVVCKIKFD